MRRATTSRRWSLAARVVAAPARRLASALPGGAPARRLAAGALAVGPAVLLGLAAPAGAQATGGAAAVDASGGTAYGTPLVRAARKPVATTFQVGPRTMTEGQAPEITLRIDQAGIRAVKARIVFRPIGGNGKLLTVSLGELRTGHAVTPAWPSGITLTAGRYAVGVHVIGAPLRRRAHASGRATLTVTPPPAPEPAPTPAPAPAPAPAPPPPTPGVFPVAGPHAIGGPDGAFGAGRPGHVHQGQDIAAAEGVPVVAPVAGTIVATSFQAGAAGYYVVQNAVDGRAFFFAHCREGSIVVAAGQPVAPGQPLCQVGSTGSATGPHLHFEIWVGGWRVSAGSAPVDPLPQLLAWGG